MTIVIPAPLVAYLCSLGALTTILLCYSLAASFKHVPAWLPTISDCAIKAPEKYPFRAGIVLAAAAFAVLVMLVYRAERAFTRSKVAVVFGLLGAISLTVIGVVNVEEWGPVHNVSASAFFFFLEIYMVLIACFSRSNKQRLRPSLASKIVKILCAIYCAAAIVVGAVLSRIGFGKYKVYIAVLEWTGTFAIGIFQIALGHDLSGEVLKVGTTENSGVSLEKTALNIDRGDKTSEKAPLLEMSNQNR